MQIDAAIAVIVAISAIVAIVAIVVIAAIGAIAAIAAIAFIAAIFGFLLSEHTFRVSPVIFNLTLPVASISIVFSLNIAPHLIKHHRQGWR